MMSHVEKVHLGTEKDPKLALELLTRRFPSEFGWPATVQVVPQETPGKAGENKDDESVQWMTQSP